MSKNYLCVPVAAVFALAIVCSCGNKSKKASSSVDDDDDEATEEMEDEDLAESYLSQDLATFDLYGQAISVHYERGEHTYPVTVRFSKQGRVLEIIRTDGQGDSEKASLTRDDDGRIEWISWESDSPWVTSLSYEGEGFVAPSQCMETNQMGNYTAERYLRDADGRLLSMKFEEAIHGNTVEGEPEHVVRLSDYDERGNWLTCTITAGQYTFVTCRTISYADDPVTTDEADADADDERIKAFITDLYNSGSYLDYDFLRAHCTPRMLKKLEENYEYDGEGYAVWLFRTSSQDGKPNCVDTSGVSTVFPDADGGHWYHYKFVDGGWRGENRIKVLLRDGQCIIDDLETVYDEAFEQLQQ